MKKSGTILNYLGLISLLLIACGSNQVESRFFVEGACEDCTQIIIESLLKQPGVRSADWDPATSVAVIRHNSKTISNEGLQEALSEVGFNTQYFDANENARQQLPECCRASINKRLKRDTIMQPY